MKNNVLEYKGYHTVIEFDSEKLVLRGKIEGINDLVNFESDTPANIEKEFHYAVDDYLEFCAEINKEPDKEYKGTFNVRIAPELHKKLAVFASKNGDTLNTTVEKAIKAFVTGNSVTNSRLRNTIKIISEVLATQKVYNCEQMPIISTESSIVSSSNYKNNIKISYKEKKVK